jgi:ferric-dicitrate binding protein FerR (iron transport regulator)
MSDMPSDRLEHAARWFAARRRGVMAIEERTRYEIWASDPHNRSAMACVERAWSSLDAAKDRLQETGPHADSRHKSRLARPALLAAMCMLSLGIGILSYSDDTGFWTTLNWTDR